MKKATIITELMDLDLAFCEECKKNGAKGWIKYMSKDSILVSGDHNDNIVGRDNIFGVMTKLFGLKDIDFSWKPLICDVSDDFSMGFTSGVYTRKYIYNEENITEKGKYTSIWKKIEDEWKIVLDIGN